jgi:Spy/CpxP family protein refolding chaperone
MKKATWIWMVPVMVCIFWAGTGWSLEQGALSSPSPGVSGSAQAGGGMMGGGMKGGMTHGRHGMMSEMQKYHMRGGYGACSMMQLMGPLHRWTGMLMAHRQAIGLTPEQLDKLDDLITKHVTYAIRNMAECRINRLDLGRELHKKTIDLKAVEDLLKKITAQELNLQMDGVKLYTQVLDLLTAEQRAKVDEIIGTPFAAPWEEMYMEPYMGMPYPLPPCIGAPPQTPQESAEEPEHHGEAEKKAE